MRYAGDGKVGEGKVCLTRLLCPKASPTTGEIRRGSSCGFGCVDDEPDAPGLG